MRISNYSIISAVLALTLWAPTSFAQTTNSPAMKDRAGILADAQAYINDPRWAGSDNKTNWAIKKKYCREGNFFKMGFNRALSGRKRERGLEKITKKCKKTGVDIDQKAYFAGWDKGSLSYCSFSRGLYHGRGSTQPSWEICGPKNFEQYHKGWNIGEKHQGILAQHKRYEKDADEWKSKIVTLEDDIEYGTSNSGVTNNKLDTLQRWKNHLKSRRKDIYTLKQENPDVFDASALIEANSIPNATNWRN